MPVPDMGAGVGPVGVAGAAPEDEGPLPLGGAETGVGMVTGVPLGKPMLIPEYSIAILTKGCGVAELP